MVSGVEGGYLSPKAASRVPRVANRGVIKEASPRSARWMLQCKEGPEWQPSSPVNSGTTVCSRLMLVLDKHYNWALSSWRTIMGFRLTMGLSIESRSTES